MKIRLAVLACAAAAALSVQAQGFGGFMDGFNKGFSAMSAAQRDQAAAEALRAEVERIRAETSIRKTEDRAAALQREHAIAEWKKARNAMPGITVGKYLSGNEEIPFEAFLLTNSAALLGSNSVSLWKLADYQRANNSSCLSVAMLLEVNCTTSVVKLRDAICFSGSQATGAILRVVDVDGTWEPPLPPQGKKIVPQACERCAALQWRADVDAFFGMVETIEGFKYEEHAIHFAALDAEVKRLAGLPENADKDGIWFLRTAHQSVMKSLGRPSH